MSDDSTKIEMPYFKLFTNEEIANFTRLAMDVEDYGAFCLLRNLIWANGFLPTEKKNLAKILRFSTKKFEKIWEKISPMFSEADGKLTIPKLETQRIKYNEFIEKSREGGRKSAENRSKVSSTSVEGGLNVGSSNSKSIIHNSESNNSKSQNSEATLSQSNALASQSADGGAGASESESEPLTFEDFKKYVSALMEAGKEIADLNAYASKLFKDVVAHQTVCKWIETGILDYQKPESKKTNFQKSQEAAERVKEKIRREKEETEKQKQIAS